MMNESDNQLFEQVGSLCDVQFYGCVWKKTDFHIHLESRQCKELVFHWAYDLVMHLSWQSERYKVGGPKLSLSGEVVRLNENELRFFLDFGSESYISLVCSDITVFN